MLKRIGCLLLAVFFAAALSVPAAASVAQIQETFPAPVVTGSDERDTGTDRVITVTYTADTAETEALREAYLKELLETRTEEEIASSEEAWVLSGPLVFCEASVDGKNWCTVKALSQDDGVFELSLLEEILPALAKGGTELFRMIYGFDYSLRLVTNSDGYSAQKQNRVFAVGAPSETMTFRCPEFSYIDCAIPADAEI